MKNLLLLFGIALIHCLSLSAQQMHVQEDFNAGSLPAGWSTTAISGIQAWSVGPNGASVHPGNTNLNGSSFAYFDDDGLGGGSTNNHATLSSPAFNNTAYLKSFLEFDYNARFFNGISDSLIIEVFDGTTWQQIFQRDTDDCGNYIATRCVGNFPHAKIDISAFKNANCQVRFRYFDGNDWGWYVGIDNVEIYSPLDFDLAATAVTAPYGSCNPSTDSLAVLIKNVGANQASNFTLSYQLASNPIVNLIVTDTIFPSDSLIVEFPNPINRNFNSVQLLSVYLNWTADLSATNDTLKTTLDSLIPIQLPYFQDFESANHGWTVSGQNASWEWGQPDTNMPVINAASGGLNAFVTNLNGSYNNNETSYLNSPCFSFADTNSVPVVYFDKIISIEPRFDFLWLEFSTDGLSWQKINQGSQSQNWYNQTNPSSWNWNRNSWISVLNRFDQSPTDDFIKFRFVLQTDNSTIREGIGIDEFGISNVQNDLVLNKVRNPLNGLRDTASCESVNQTEFVELELSNWGTDTLDTLITSVDVAGLPLLKDTTYNLGIAPGQTLIHTLSKPLNFPNNQLYTAKIWFENPKDLNASNDTLANIIFDVDLPNNLFQTPYLEDFNSLLVPAIPGSYSTNSQQNFSWQSNNGGTSSAGTGPVTADGNYLYTESSSPAGTGDNAILESPCILIKDSSNYFLYYDYFKHGNTMGDLIVEVYENNQWQNVNTLIGETHPNQNDPWSTDTINLAAFAGEIVQFRFTGTYGGGFRGDMAIDNILITDTTFIDVGIAHLSPVSSCYLYSQEAIRISVRNLGQSDILPNQLSLNYSLNNQTVVTEFYPDTLKADSISEFTFNQTADLSGSGQSYNLLLYADLANDVRSFNDSTQLQIVNESRGFSQSPSIIEDFEGVSTICHDDFSASSSLPAGWSYGRFAPHHSWLVQDASSCLFGASAGATETDLTGPSSAYSGNQFLYYEATTTGNNQIKTNCINPRNMSQLMLEFYFYMYGDGMGKLMIEVEDSVGNVQLVDSIVGPAALNGQTHFNNSSSWLRKQVVLDSFINQPFNVIFRVVDVQSNRSDIAIDDVSFFNPLTVKLDEKKNESNTAIIIYPNPSEGIYQVRSIENLAGEYYQIFDLKGQLIKEGVLLNNFNQIDLSQAPAGVYFLQVEKLSVRKKLIKY